MTDEDKALHVTGLLTRQVTSRYQPEDDTFYEAFSVAEDTRNYAVFQPRYYNFTEQAWEEALEYARGLGGVLTVPPGFESKV